MPGPGFKLTFYATRRPRRSNISESSESDSVQSRVTESSLSESLRRRRPLRRPPAAAAAAVAAARRFAHTAAGPRHWRQPDSEAGAAAAAAPRPRPFGDYDRDCDAGPAQARRRRAAERRMAVASAGLRTQRKQVTPAQQHITDQDGRSGVTSHT